MSYDALHSVRRCRDYHLYTADGKRYLDMYLNGGRALLGHKPAGLSLILKTEIQKGLMAEVPTAFSRRLEKALLRLATAAPRKESPPRGGSPGAVFRLRLYANFDRALTAAAALLGKSFTEQDIAEPFFASPGDPVYFRPCTTVDYTRFPVLFPVLPFPAGFAPQPLLYKDVQGQPPASDAVSPLLAAGLTRLAENLSSAAEELQTGGEFPDIWKEWRLPGWTRFGCYCFRTTSENYAHLANRFFAAGLIISPAPGRPTILPRLFSPGEQRLVERLCSETFGRNT